MKSLRIFALGSPGEVRVALTRGDQLEEFAIWRPGAPDGVGDLHRGRVIAHVPGMAGSFIALTGSPDGFLPDSASPPGRTLGAGDHLGLRISRAAQGDKGPRLTARLTAEEDALTAEGPTSLIRRGPGAVALLAALHPTIPILADSDALAARLSALLGRRVAAERAGLPHPIADQIAALEAPQTLLPSGVRLSFHPTPALVAIDMDAGAALDGATAKQGAHMGANLAAIPALARQIRLRNFSGAILVDFAGLSPKKREKLGPALEAELAKDRLGPKLLGFTRLGLAEIVRPRIHPPLHELLTGPHAAGLAALRELARESAARPAARLTLHTSPAIAEALARDPVALSDLADSLGHPIAPVSDPTLTGTTWRIAEHERN